MRDEKNTNKNKIEEKEARKEEVLMYLRDCSTLASLLCF